MALCGHRDRLLAMDRSRRAHRRHLAARSHFSSGCEESPPSRAPASSLYLAAARPSPQRNRARTRFADTTQRSRRKRCPNHSRRSRDPHHTHPSYPIHLSLRQYHPRRTERESRPARRLRRWPSNHRRPAGYPLRPRGSTIPGNPLRRPTPRLGLFACAGTLPRSRSLGCHCVAAPAGHRRSGLAEDLRRHDYSRRRTQQLRLLAAFACNRPAANA